MNERERTDILSLCGQGICKDVDIIIIRGRCGREREWIYSLCVDICKEADVEEREKKRKDTQTFLFSCFQSEKGGETQRKGGRR